MKKIYLYILLFILAPFSVPVLAQQDVKRSLDAIVEVRITVPKNARTAERFGTNRVASGVRTEESFDRLFVKRVTSGGPFEKAGIKTGDIILAVNKQAVNGMADFYRKVWALGKAGVDVPLTILQGIRIQHIVVHSATRNRNRQPKQNDPQYSEKL